MAFDFDAGRRRTLKLAGLIAAGAALDALLPVMAADDPDLEAIKALKPGAFVWHPERAPDGFVAVVVNLSDQMAYVYRNGVRIGVTTVSTGKDGFGTPTGVFTILQKDVDHHSSLYNDASMPYTERLTWSGVALHAGGLPGYPSSHGCVHLPLAFAKLLFGITHLGTTVIIADNHTAPQDVLHPGLVMSENLEQELAVDATGQGAPQDGQTPQAPGAAAPPPEPVSIVISGADRTLIGLKGGKPAVTGPVTIADPGTPLGNVVYVLTATAPGQPARWNAVSLEGGDAVTGAAQRTLSRIGIDTTINQQVAALVKPGATLFITDLPAHPDTRTNQDFVVLTHKAAS
jgi:hypothetical protein